MPGDVMDQQLEDLRDRMRLLQQDRRANVDVLESSKTNNSEEVRFLREENKELRVRLSGLQRNGESSSDKPGGHGHDGSEELNHLKREVLTMRAEYDTLNSLGKARSDDELTMEDDNEVIGSRGEEKERAGFALSV
jgi:hypothetical protein